MSRLSSNRSWGAVRGPGLSHSCWADQRGNGGSGGQERPKRDHRLGQLMDGCLLERLLLQGSPKLQKPFLCYHKGKIWG